MRTGTISKTSHGDRGGDGDQSSEDSRGWISDPMLLSNLGLCLSNLVKKHFYSAVVTSESEDGAELSKVG